MPEESAAPAAVPRGPGMTIRIVIVTALLAAVVAVVLLKARGKSAPVGNDAKDLPRLVDLGAGECIPCKAMAPILDELREDYHGTFAVVFIDVWKNPAAKKQYGVKLIPTQIFYDASGRELFRHEGFFSRNDILAKWKELGFDFGPDRSGSGGGTLQVGLEWLTRAVKGSAALALFAALLWGILSILLSPCHLASIPLIVGFIDRQGRTSARRAFLTSTLFAVGILITIAAIGAITAAAGRMLGDVGAWGNYLVAAIFLVVGLVLADVIPMPWSGPGQVNMKRRGPLAAFVLGLVFGVALGPCTFAYMAPMLGIVFKLGAENWAWGALLLAVYGAGHCSVIVIAGTSTELVQRYLNWNQKSRGAILLKRACGILVLAGGLYLIHAAA